MAGERPAAVILVLVSIATAQIFEPDVTRTQGCCNAVMLPYDGKAVIQSEREVRSQRYLGFRARFCNMDPFYLQAWELESEQKRTWTLKWQKLIEPPFIGVASIPLDFTYEATQRVGLQGVANRTRQLPVPYKFRPDSSYLLRSLEPAGGAKPGPFIPKQSYAFTEITWPLSFNEDMQFCFEKGCHDLLADLPGGIEGIPGPPGPPGPQGIPGPPGPPGTADKSSCDLNGQGEEISNDIKVLKSAVDGIAATLQGTAPSGICKEGYLKGSFGLPYCYKFFNIPLQMAEASMTCVDDGGRLADIETKEEFQFVASVIPFPPQSAGELTKMRYSHWLTSGIYSDDDGAWVWYDRGNAKITLPKDTWEGDMIPYPKASSKYLLNKICVVLARDIETGNVRLKQVACRVPRFYICKQYKKCS